MYELAMNTISDLHSMNVVALVSFVVMFVFTLGISISASKENQ